MVIEYLEPRRLLALFGPDVSFGNGGHAVFPAVNALDVLPDGKIFVAGARMIPPQGFDDPPGFVQTISRLNADGTPDESFAPGGRMELPVSSFADYAGTRLYYFQNGL